ADLRKSFPRGGAGAAEPAGEVLLAGRLVAEDVEDAGLGRDGVGAECLFEVGPQLVLAVILLEGAPAGEGAVAEGHLAVAAAGHADLGGHHEQPAAQGEGPAERFGAFLGSSMTLMT